MEFHASLMAYCYATRASTSSYGRTAAHNRDVGGTETSYHLQWLAADVVYDVPMVKAAKDRIAGRFGLEVIEESDHDHVEPLP